MAPKCMVLSSTGPEGGLARVHDIDPAMVLSGSPNEHSASFASVDGKFDVGIFQADAYEERIENYPVAEVMVILEGQARLESDDGTVTELRRGDVAYIENGWTGYWRQSARMRKFTVMYTPD
ncbi:cupin domain-containing protein [Defluviimonas sp. CAU 1641]|uniref:Cupin domain-containing protein n=2 Tax=Defluviimonas salinarum TaxID=2992147 RepID=A0ABT3J7J0_9RHOB|nr:cupin domain-containing protein [Defluviimonas salinarum]